MHYNTVLVIQLGLTLPTFICVDQVIAEHVYSSRFGTFIVNSESEREEVSTKLYNGLIRSPLDNV